MQMTTLNSTWNKEDNVSIASHINDTRTSILSKGQRWLFSLVLERNHLVAIPPKFPQLSLPLDYVIWYLHFGRPFPA